MANIGTFKRTDKGFDGTIKTLTLNVKAQLQQLTNDNDKAPDYRVVAAGSVELGAGWNKRSQAGAAYVAVKLDDPSFPAPVYANLVEQDDGWALIWTRPAPRRG
jgi:uncharacterized protein (DUF736 family)